MDLLREVAKIVDETRALHRHADEIWNAAPVAEMEPLLRLRNELEHRIADLESVEL